MVGLGRTVELIDRLDHDVTRQRVEVALIANDHELLLKSSSSSIVRSDRAEFSERTTSSPLDNSVHRPGAIVMNLGT